MFLRDRRLVFALNNATRRSDAAVSFSFILFFRRYSFDATFLTSPRGAAMQPERVKPTILYGAKA
jgi:hypothetical protein